IITVVTTLLSFLNIFFSYTTLFRSGRMRSVRAALLSWRLLDQMRRVLRSVSGTAGAPAWKTLSTCRRGLSPKPVAGDLRGRAHRSFRLPDQWREVLGEFGHGGRFEDGDGVQRHGELVAEPGGDLVRRQRVTADVEEVICPAHR